MNENAASEDQKEKMKDRCCPKSPVTIQEWVDSISLHKSEEEFQSSQGRVIVSSGSKLEVDTLHLGAEAGLTDTKLGKCTSQFASIKCVQYDPSVQDRRANLIQMKEKSSLQSDISSNSTSSSIETLLESRREDPEEILLSLGFGGCCGSLDPLARIPKRFLKPSEVKGNDLDQFVRHQEELLEALDSGFCGYRGLSGFLRENQRPVGIVGKILDKIRADRSLSNSPTCSLTSFSEVAFSVLAANSFRNALLRSAKQQIESPGGSILEPANREFLEHQGENPENERRLILGQDEFCVGDDGNLVHSRKVMRPMLSKHRSTSLVSEDEEIDETINSNNNNKGKTSKFSFWNVCKQLTAKEETSDDVSNLTKRSDRVLVRQNSICLDTNEGLLPEHFINAIEPESEINVEIQDEDESVQPMCTLPISNDEKLSTYKESFELEELPSHGEEIGDDQVQEEEHRHSALSDSSGFLDGETTELLQMDKVTQPDDRSNENNQNPPRLVRPAPVRLGVLTSTFENKAFDETEREDLLIKNTFRPINIDETASSIPEFRLIVSDHDTNISFEEGDDDKEEENEESLPSLSLETVQKPPCFRSEVQLSINNVNEMSQETQQSIESTEPETTQVIPYEISQDNPQTLQNFSQDSLEIPSCSNVSIVSRVAEVIQSQEMEEVTPGNTRRRSLVTTTVKTQELVVTPHASPQVSPRVSPNTFQEEDEYHDLQRLLRIISNGEIQSKLSRQEFFSKPIKERARVEAVALQMALKKYQQTLHNDQSTLNRYKDACEPDQKEELILLHDLHAGICKEVGQLQLLLKSRLQNINKAKLLPLSIRLIRQFSLLLHQQNFLCQQLERLKRQESNYDTTVEKYEISNEDPDEEKNKIQFLLENFHHRLYTDLHQKIDEENASLKKELEHNRKELHEIKYLLKQLISKHGIEGTRTLGDEIDTPQNRSS